MNRNSIVKFFFIILFFGAIITPYTLMVFNIEVEKVDLIERRKLAKKPDFNKTSITKYPGKYESYINDNLPFRTQFTSKYIHTWEVYLSSFVRELLQGKNNQYYRHSVVEYYLGLHKYPLQQLYLFKTIIAGRQAFWESYDASYTFILIPDKTTLYPEYLPNWMENNNWFTQLSSVLRNTQINFIDFNEKLNHKKKDSIPLYDNVYDVAHWNGNALDFTYKELNKQFKDNAYFKPTPSDSAYKIEYVEIKSSVYFNETVPIIVINTKGLHYQRHNYPTNMKHKWAFCDIVTNDKIEKGTLLLASDSYFKGTHQRQFEGANGCIFPLAHNVNKFIQIHYAEQFNTIKEIARNEKPNIVVESGVERAVFNGFMKNLHLQGENNYRLLIAGEKLLNANQFVILPSSLTKTQYRNCHIVRGSNHLKIIAETKDPFIFLPTQKTNKDGRIVLMAKIHSPMNTIMQVYYAQGDEKFNGSRCIKQKLTKGINYIHIPIYARKSEEIRLRFDPGNNVGTYKIYPMPSVKEMFEEDI